MFEEFWVDMTNLQPVYCPCQLMIAIGKTVKGKYVPYSELGEKGWFIVYCKDHHKEHNKHRYHGPFNIRETTDGIWLQRNDLSKGVQKFSNKELLFLLKLTLRRK